MSTSGLRALPASPAGPAAGTETLALALAHLAAQLGRGDRQAGTAQLFVQPRCNALLPLAHRAAQLGHLALDAEQQARCAHAYFQSAGNAQRVQAELARIAGLFSAAGIPILVLKGSAFVFDLYADAGVRPAGDLDLLVPPERLEEAARILQAQDYALVNAFHQHGLRELSRPGRHPGKANVDIHTRVGPWRDWTAPGYPVDVAGIWRRAPPFALPGTAAPLLQMSPEDALLFVSFQVGQHAFDKFTSYFDLHALVATGRVDDTRLAALSRADGGHVFRVFAYCALEVTHALLGTRVPESWLRHTRPGALRRAFLARWASPGRILAGRIPADTPYRYVFLARAPADVARMAVSVAGHLGRKVQRG